MVAGHAASRRSAHAGGPALFREVVRGYEIFARLVRRGRRPKGQAAIAAFLRKAAPGLRSERRRGFGGGYALAYSFPPLSVCRAEYECRMGRRMPWPPKPNGWGASAITKPRSGASILKTSRGSIERAARNGYGRQRAARNGYG